MKKTYINPELEVIKIAATMQMLAVSGDAPDISGDEFNPGGGDVVESPGLIDTNMFGF